MNIRHGLIAHRALVIEEFINLLDFGVVLLFQQGVFLIELFLLPLDGLLFFVFLKVLLLFGKLCAQLGLLALGGGARVGGEFIQPRFDLCDIRALFGGGFGVVVGFLLLVESLRLRVVKLFVAVELLFERLLFELLLLADILHAHVDDIFNRIGRVFGLFGLGLLVGLGFLMDLLFEVAQVLFLFRKVVVGIVQVGDLLELIVVILAEGFLVGDFVEVVIKLLFIVGFLSGVDFFL